MNEGHYSSWAFIYVFLMFFVDNFKSDGVLRTMFFI